MGTISRECVNSALASRSSFALGASAFPSVSASTRDAGSLMATPIKPPAMSSSSAHVHAPNDLLRQTEPIQEPDMNELPPPPKDAPPATDGNGDENVEDVSLSKIDPPTMDTSEVDNADEKLVKELDKYLES